MRGHCDLIAWRKAMGLVTEIYRAARNLLRMSSMGWPVKCGALRFLPSNLAEGCRRTSRADLDRFIAQARGSLLVVDPTGDCRNLGYLSPCNCHRIAGQRQ
jgi:hypothetical protein